ncbi:hypothetical protein M378DRAFT_163066 [Amanita muscaria Koide BX008]|uniref:Uncharacterized protein n=1 Tax=Amanita muscaria (strain Koide BX008) TaxID=946122 RepID=A0A0C2X790_AMAMK|nr:hypothetical protein M378DRAFT_163066 [Amanita muscaria Koide BX008]
MLDMKHMNTRKQRRGTQPSNGKRRGMSKAESPTRVIDATRLCAKQTKRVCTSAQR